MRSTRLTTSMNTFGSILKQRQQKRNTNQSITGYQITTMSLKLSTSTTNTIIIGNKAKFISLTLLSQCSTTTQIRSMVKSYTW